MFTRLVPVYLGHVPEAKEETAVDKLWKEYSKSLSDFDDLTLARWCSQTLGQLRGRTWRLSHPLVGAYRLAAQLAHDRQIWLQRLVNLPPGYLEASCCRAPLLPLLTRDVGPSGLICMHCNDTAVATEQIPGDLPDALRKWSEMYAPVHDVAHWDEERRRQSTDFDAEFEAAAQRVEEFLADAATDLVPRLLEHYPAVVWEDQDECLEVRPEDVLL
ncbi:MAG TPA: hypothetical protein PLX89_07100 [Verrucomicrobiota bacterium]|nr:hypothetical protein [Verrucomicrobiales bacterium]HRI12758.1 hypothetical protein [Verrucomicrobiota bacterium]